jgi:hypothetical protein
MLLSTGQQEARTRWGTQESGAAFDRKKMRALSNEAQEFIAQQTLCIVGGPGVQQTLSGLVIAGLPGFVQMPDQRTCLVPIDSGLLNAPIIQRIYQAQQVGEAIRIALCFLNHATRQRICVQGRARLSFLSSSHDCTWICLYVEQAFFHCPKYIRTQIPGLTADISGERWRLKDLLVNDFISEAISDFLGQRMLCYLCTMNRAGHCGINHRGGKVGFLVPLPPTTAAPKGCILFPDYAGNGAFEAIGNILETGLAALIIPSYADHLALILSGQARVIEPESIAPDLRSRCAGAQRVLLLAVQRIEGQLGNWGLALAYERNRSLHQLQANARDRTTTCTV